MYHLVGNFQNKSGDALAGYFVKLKDSDGAYATLYSDTNGTPIATVSGVANTAICDSTGVYDIWVADGVYDIEFFDKSDASLLISRTLTVPMNSGQFAHSGAGAVTRTLQQKLSEFISVVDYGADPTGVVLADDAFLKAKNAAQNSEGGGTVYVPQGVYLVNDLPLLDASGFRLVGDSRFATRLKVQTGTTGAVLYNPSAASGVSGLHHISDIFFDLNAQNVTAIDLSSVNNSVVERVRVTGGTSLGTATGVGVRCAAPLDSGSYTNKIGDCDGTYLDRAFVAEDAANENNFDNCEAIVCNIGFDIESGVDTIRLEGGRAEGCNIGLRTGGRETICHGVRFEANNTADVSIMAGAERPSFLSCHTATSTTVILNEANATGLLSMGGSFPKRNLEPNTSNPSIQAARQTFAAASSAAAIAAALDAGTTSAIVPGVSNYAAYFYDPLYLRNAASSLEAVNATNDNTVLMMSVDSSNRVNIPGYDRKAGAYTRIYVGENFSFNGTGLEYGGVKVLGTRQTAVGDAAVSAAAPTKAEFDAFVAKFNLLLDKLGTAGHGLTAD